jgi:hypothetical protein
LNDESSANWNRATSHGGGIYNNATDGATLNFGIGWIGTVSHNKPDDIFNE